MYTSACVHIPASLLFYFTFWVDYFVFCLVGSLSWAEQSSDHSSDVSLIMVSYALFAFMMLNGLLAFCIGGWRKKVIDSEIQEQCKVRVEQLMLFSRLMLYPAVFCLGAGIFIGAVWANVSWGRYWALDPKEVWALITFLIYDAAFHGQSLAVFRQPRFFHAYMVLAFLTVLMTYFGVNYLLGGMHSYA